jgi:Tfp pilus assembly pilus retraction ATPase PilT
MNSITGYTTDDLLDLVVTENASALSLRVGRPPVVSLRGDTHVIEGPEISPENADEMLRGLATTRQIRELREQGRIELIHVTRTRAQFRVLVESVRDELHMDLERITTV